MSRLPPKPDVHFNTDGLLFADGFGDSYFSREDGLAESRTVFLAGNHLPDAWTNKSTFVIGELGFGTGLNVLAAWQLWNTNRPPNGQLHIVTYEAFLLDRSAAQNAHAQWPEIKTLSDQLIARWPSRAYGIQRLWFEEDGVCITIIIGPCAQTLPQSSFQADCWFLDGFAPSKNPLMWSQEVAHEIARLSAPHATLATYSVARSVRDNFAQAGFELHRLEGFGTKRQRLVGRRSGSEANASQFPKSAIVIGGGIAGAAICAALRRRHIDVHLLDDDVCGRTKASGNPMALIAPRLDRGETNEARFYRDAYLMACDTYRQMPSEAFVASGVRERAPSPSDEARLAQLRADPPLPEEHFAQETDIDGLFHTQGGIVFPDQVLKHLKHGADIHPIRAQRIDYDNGQWRVWGDGDTPIVCADMCVVAAGMGYRDLVQLGVELGARAGQLSYLRAPTGEDALAICGGGYGAALDDRIFFGATFDAWPIDQKTPPPVTPAGHAHNLAILNEIAPEIGEKIDLNNVAGRTSIRVTTPDHLPLAGPVSHVISQQATGLYVVAGLGSRGFTTAFLCAEIIASHASGDPAPAQSNLISAIAPDRFALRLAKKMQNKPKKA